MKSSRLFCKISLLLAPVLALSLAAQVKPVSRKSSGDRHKRAAYLEPSVINFIRPGVVVKIVSANIAPDGTITARVNLTDPKGLPLDQSG